VDQSVVTVGSREGTDVGEVWRRAHELARAWWPGIELPLQQFASHLQRLDWKRALPEYAKELYLCCACSLGFPEACRRLESDYFPALEAALHRQCGRRDFVEDVLQQVRERLLVGSAPKIASYEGKGPLSSWLQRIVRRAACDVYRKENQARRLASGWWQVVESLAPGPSSESDGSSPSEARYIGALERALLEALGQLSLEERSLLKLSRVERRRDQPVPRA
jgi:RNA polymerase sigma-70 factor